MNGPLGTRESCSPAEQKKGGSALRPRPPPRDFVSPAVKKQMKNRPLDLQTVKRQDLCQTANVGRRGDAEKKAGRSPMLKGRGGDDAKNRGGASSNKRLNDERRSSRGRRGQAKARKSLERIRIAKGSAAGATVVF